MKKLEYAIHEEKKKHELQKHIYNQNIEKLKKIAGMQAPHLSRTRS
jgi:NAD-dependent SIR2 family protein deacetylase